MTDLQTLMTQAARDREPLDTPPFELLVDRAWARGRRRLAGWGAGVLVAAAAGAVVIPQLAHRTPAQPAGSATLTSVSATTGSAPEGPGAGAATVTGQLIIVDGPRGDAGAPIPGTISASRVGDLATFTVSATADGLFRIEVAPGTYTFSGTSPLYLGGEANCEAAGTVTVIRGSNQQVIIACQRR